MIVAYVSGHGFGHATRTAEVLRQLRRLKPEAPITIVSTAPEALFRGAIGGAFTFRRLECDAGLVQKDALTIDEAQSAERCLAFARDFPDLVDTEWRFLRHVGAAVVVGDIPPLAFQASHEAGVPSLALANFSWDWVYRHLAVRHPRLRDVAARCAESYARAGLLLRLPFAGELTAFPRVEDIPLVARRPRVERAEARRRLKLGGETILLLSFGGFGLPDLSGAALAAVRGVRLLTSDRVESPPAHLRVVGAAELEARELGYEDLVGASDVVVTKPGYGIVSDAIGAGVRVIYTERGDFPEYPLLVAGMERWLACAHLPRADLLAGRWMDAIRAVLARQPPPSPEANGAQVAAQRILETLARGR